MTASVYLNERVVPAASGRVRATSAAMLYGRGVFTTLAVYERRPFLWPQHWQRLLDHSARVGVDTTQLEERRVRQALAEVLEANRISHGRARITLLRRDLKGSPWQTVEAVAATTEAAAKESDQLSEDERQFSLLEDEDEGGATDLLIITGEARAVSTEGLALTVSPYRTNSRSPLAGLKSLNYLEHLLAQEEARGRGFDEAVRLNERGEVVSAAMANIFWVTGGRVHTPALQTGALAGTTRERVIALAHELSVPLVEGVYDLGDVGDAQEIFLTSASLGLEIVTTFDFHRYTVPMGSTALRLHEAFRQLTLAAEEAEQN